VNSSSHIWISLYKWHFCVNSTFTPLLTLAPFFPPGFYTCIVIGGEILIIFFKFCNLDTTDYFMMLWVAMYYSKMILVISLFHIISTLRLFHSLTFSSLHMGHLLFSPSVSLYATLDIAAGFKWKEQGSTNLPKI
jgi:hypothetical protein